MASGRPSASVRQTASPAGRSVDGEGDRQRPRQAAREPHLVDDAPVVGLAHEALEGRERARGEHVEIAESGARRARSGAGRLRARAGRGDRTRRRAAVSAPHRAGRSGGRRSASRNVPLDHQLARKSTGPRPRTRRLPGICAVHPGERVRFRRLDFPHPARLVYGEQDATEDSRSHRRRGARRAGCPRTRRIRCECTGAPPQRRPDEPRRPPAGRYRQVGPRRLRRRPRRASASGRAS